MDGQGPLLDLAIGPEVAMVAPIRDAPVDDLDTADLNDPMPFLKLKTCRFDI
jgi:hypothetical protein